MTCSNMSQGKKEMLVKNIYLMNVEHIYECCYCTTKNSDLAVEHFCVKSSIANTFRITAVLDEIIKFCKADIFSS